MYEINCLDSKGNTINNFTQWDVDQSMSIDLEGCDEGYLSIAPNIHFTNNTRDYTFVVRSTVTDGCIITADVPNILLQEAYPLLVYVYLTDNERVSSQKTILATEIPIRKRAKPDDYFYVENIERITAQQIKKEIMGSINNGEFIIYNITFEDVKDSTEHRVYVSDGKFTIESVSDGIQTNTVLDMRDKQDILSIIDSVANIKADKTEIPTLYSQIGAEESGTADKKIWEHSSDVSTHLDIRQSIRDVDDKINAIEDSIGGAGYIKVGDYTFMPASNGNLTLVYTGK